MTRKTALAARLALVVLGVGLLGFSIACMLWAGQGSDPTTVCVDGIAAAARISYGTASNLVNLAMLVALAVVNRKKIHIATVAAALGVGPAINLFYGAVFATMPKPGLLVGLLVCTAAVVLNSVGLATYLCANLGAAAFDGLILTLHERFSLSYKTAMRLFYAVFFAAGVLLGGVWGVGTLLSLLLGSYVFDKLYPQFYAKAAGLFGYTQAAK